MANINELEQIIRIGVFEKDFNVIGMKVRMRTLTGGEAWDISREVSGYDELAKFSGIKLKTLAHSIVSINDKLISYVPKDAQDTITEEKKIIQNEEIIRKWQDNLINLFYEKYTELRGEQQNFLQQSQVSSSKPGVAKSGRLENVAELTKS